jgi:RHS repeat-associated protein
VIPDIPGSAASGQIPADAGTVQTTETNPLGQTTALVQYTANPSVSIPSDPATGSFYISGGTPIATTYTYDAQGDQNSQTTGGDSWSQQYNLLGQETQSTDPSGGTTTMTYDANGNLLQSQDAEGNYVSYTYDQLGRQTAEYAAPSSGQVNYASASSPGNETASWVYDNANDVVTSMKDADGQVTTETSYANGYAYTIQQIGFNVFGESTGEVVEIPTDAPGGSMGTDYVFTNTYQPINGTPLKSSYPSGGGLPSETVTYSTTSALDLPSAVGGLDGYAEQTSYTAYGQVEQVILGAGSDEAAITDSYDPHTGNITDQLVTRSGDAQIDGDYTGADLDNTSYTYNTANQITSETDQRFDSAASTETQCYTYTTQQQLAEAWTATDNCAATPTTTSDSTVGDALGTSSEYFESFAYNAAGERASETALDPATGTFATTTYGYAASQPTALTSTSTTGAVTASTSYGYDADGQQTTRDATIGDQTLTWNNSGQLTGVTSTATGAQDASYVYGPDGSLLSQTNGSATTLYLPGEQLTDNNGTISGIRYYALPGGATAVRTGLGDAYYFEVPSDEHGTNTLYLDYTAQNPTWRQFDPFGNPRGTATTWIDNRTFLNDVSDPATSLTDIGARWYDPTTGTFISLDPLLEIASPLQLNGYTYASDNPVSESDPTGLSGPMITDGGNGGGCAPSIPGCPGYSDQGNSGGEPKTGTAHAGSGSTSDSNGYRPPPNLCHVDLLACYQTPLQLNEDTPQHDNGLNWTPKPVECVATEFGLLICASLASGDTSDESETTSVSGAAEEGIERLLALAGDSSDCVDPDECAAAARYARDLLGREAGRTYATYVGGYNSETGEVFVGCSSSLGCAEGDIVRQGGDTFTKAFGWRGGEWTEIEVCTTCQATYSPEQFPPDVTWEEGGGWDRLLSSR